MLFLNSQKLYISCMTWTALSIILDCCFIAFSFLKKSSGDEVPQGLFISSATAVAFIRLYITQVLFEGLKRLSLQSSILLPTKCPEEIVKPVKTMKPAGTDYQCVKSYYMKSVGLGALMGLIIESVCINTIYLLYANYLLLVS